MSPLQRRFVAMIAAAVIGGTFAAGLFIHGRVGGVLLVVVDVVLIGLAWALWPRLQPRGRPFRAAVIAIVGVVGVIKLVHG